MFRIGLWSWKYSVCVKIVITIITIIIIIHFYFIGQENIMNKPSVFPWWNCFLSCLSLPKYIFLFWYLKN